MAGDEAIPPEAAQLKGLAKHFNSITPKGRANVAKATYAVIGVIILYNVLKPKKKSAPAS
ncbi:uncharacterized protein LOC134527363 [Bacillus rossius redtenbacheri]|uniref:uncharacterized protein LOC134527363 n=1 Tax=Bacillus rossius redtenbacheri TaxID=93214 RepID=UPI002FDD4DBF